MMNDAPKGLCGSCGSTTHEGDASWRMPPDVLTVIATTGTRKFTVAGSLGRTKKAFREAGFAQA